MSTSGHTGSAQTQAHSFASRAQIALLRVVWLLGAVITAVSVFLVGSALATDSSAGESWQPAGIPGLLGLCVGGTLLIVGLLTRLVVKGRQRP
ncbi:hypothetical protein [Streptomyces sp. NPDC058308]|uniref:hypothetical protein n=1 Tax=Streptomyces sp. NPDC058308 TaxID=3346440 RepID=UPI0036EE151B